MNYNLNYNMNYNIFYLIIPVLIFLLMLYELRKLYYVSIIKRKKTPLENRIQVNAVVYLILGTIFFYSLLKN